MSGRFLLRGPAVTASVPDDAVPELSLLDMFEAAAHDEVTGTLTRRAWRTRAEREIAATGPDRTLALLMVDLDHFKQHNDRYGHLGGDLVLGEVVWAIRRSLRHVDLIGRFGGDELAILLPDVDHLHCAVEIAERLRRRVEDLTVHLPRDLSGAGGYAVDGLTVSIGAAVTRAGTAPRLADLIGVADAAMYAAKASGRNAVRAGETPVGGRR